MKEVIKSNADQFKGAPEETPNETPKKPTGWEIVEALNADFLDDERETAESAVSPEFAATNQEVYDDLIKHLNNDVYIAESNQASPEVIAEARSSRDLLVDAYLDTVVSTKDGEPTPSLTDALEKRQSICEQKAEIYLNLGDIKTAEHNHKLSKLASTLINHVATVKHNIESEKNPDSLYNKNANAFRSDPAPASADALPGDILV